MKNLIFTFVFLLVSSIGLSENSNKAESFSYDPDEDCAEEAFDAMDEADEKGADYETISEIGQYVYCLCHPDCRFD